MSGPTHAAAARLENSPSETSPTVAARPVAPLRIWPAIVLLLAIGVFKVLPRFFEEPSPRLFMTMFFGPMVCGLIAVLWWLFLSRARWSERLLGLVAVVGIAFAAGSVADRSLEMPVQLMFILPSGIAGFLIGAIAFSQNRSALRTLGVTAFALVGFGAWDLIRSEGFTGDFKTSFHWRWSASTEERGLADLKAEKIVAPTNANSQTLGETYWSEFRGSNRDGRVHGVVLDPNWTAHPPKEIWRRKFGPAWSSFAIAGDRLFTQEQREGMEAVLCLDAATGKLLWMQQSSSRFYDGIAGAGPRATPTISGGMLFTFGANGLLHRLDPITGAVVWQRDVSKEADRKPPMWGYSSSPLATGGLVIVHAGGKDANGVIAFDMATGNRRWSAASGDHTYSSPQLARIADRDLLLMVTNAGLSALNPADGKLAWKYDADLKGGYRALQPLVLGDGAVLMADTMMAGTHRVDAPAITLGTPVKDEWLTTAMRPDFNDFVEHKGFVYGFDNIFFACIDVKNGERKWRSGRKIVDRAGQSHDNYGKGQVLLLADGDQLLVLSEAGEVALLKADPEKLDELARFKAIEGKTWNHPVLVGDRLYVRNGEEGACFELPLARAATKGNP